MDDEGVLSRSDTGSGVVGGDIDRVDSLEKKSNSRNSQRMRHNGCMEYSTSTVALVVIVTEFCERLAYYGLAGSLVLFFQTRLNFSNAMADVQFSAWSGVCYVTPLLGGYIADSYLGRYKTIILFSSIYVVGLALMTVAAVPSLNYWGLVVIALYTIALGTGGIKPNVSTLGADQFDDTIPEEKEAKQSFFGWFYFSINCGAAVAYTLVSYICQYGAGEASGGKEWGFFWGFLIPTIAMALGVVVFMGGNTLFGYTGTGKAGAGGAPATVEDHSTFAGGGGCGAAGGAAAGGGGGGAGSKNPLHSAEGYPLPFGADDVREEVERQHTLRKTGDLDIDYDDEEDGHSRQYADERISVHAARFTVNPSDGSVKRLEESHSEVVVLFSVLYQGTILYVKAKLGFGTGTFVSPNIDVEGAARQLQEFNRDAGVSMVDMNSTTDAEDSCVPAGDEKDEDEGVVPIASRLHVLDYACRDNYSSSGGDWDPAKPLPTEPGQGHYSFEQVQAAKMVVRVLPFLGVLVLFWTIYSQMSVGFQNQGCQMDLSLSSDPSSAAKIPISALNLFDTLSILIIVPLLNKLVYPWMKKRYGSAPKLLSRIAVGFVLTIMAMVVAGIVEHVRKQHIPVYNYAAGQGYYNDANALANASPCINRNDYNPAAYQAWWQYHKHVSYYANKFKDDSSYIVINGFKVFPDAPASEYCHQTCDLTTFANIDIDKNTPTNEILSLSIACVACDPIPQVSKMSVLWQIPQFCLIGAAEVLASVSSLDFFYSQAPQQFRSVVQSFNLATTALGSIIVIPLIIIVNSGNGNNARTTPGNFSTASGPWVPGDLNYGHLDSFFYLLGGLMLINIMILKYISKGYLYQSDSSLKRAIGSKSQ